METKLLYVQGLVASMAPKLNADDPARVETVRVSGMGGYIAEGRRLFAEVSRRVWPNAGRSRAAPGTLAPLTGWSHAGQDSVLVEGRPATIAVLVYQGVSSSEVEIVADALAKPLGARVRLVAKPAGPLAAVEPARALVAEPLEAVSEPYGLVVPGGLAWRSVATDPKIVAWLETAVASARGVITVSTGSLLLATTGILNGREAAGHWLAHDLLSELGANPSSDRTVHSRLMVTTSGAFSGAEAADRLATEMRFSF